VRNAITLFLTSTLRPEWTLFEETHMAKTGLILSSSSLLVIDDGVDQLGLLQPDWILVRMILEITAAINSSCFVV
jgi:hypothetical protein